MQRQPPPPAPPYVLSSRHCFFAQKRQIGITPVNRPSHYVHENVW